MKKFKLMFVTGGFDKYTPQTMGYCGGQEFSTGQAMIDTLCDTIEAIKGLDVELVIRVHNDHEIKTVQDILNREGVKNVSVRRY